MNKQIEEAVRFIAEMAGCPRCGSKDLKVELILYIPNLMITKLTIRCWDCNHNYNLYFKDEVLWNINSEIERSKEK